MPLEIVKYGHPVLRMKGKPVGSVSPEIEGLAEQMLEAMRQARGIGLAAQQVGHALQMAVVDVSGIEERPSSMLIGGEPVDIEGHMPLWLIDPQITPGKQRDEAEEGCLSFPEIAGDIRRSVCVHVTCTTLQGEKLEFDAEGLLSRAIQHEFDHLQGILFIDRMRTAQRVSLGSRLKQLKRESADRYGLVKVS